MLLWTWALRQFAGSQRRVNAAALSAVAVELTSLVNYHGIVQSDYAEAWSLQQRYTQEIVEILPAVEPETHIVISGVPTQYRSSYVFMFSTEHMLRLVYGDSTIAATAINSGFNDWRLDAAGLRRGDELVAPAERIVFVQLDKNGCPEQGDAGCGRLVLAENIGQSLIASGQLGPHAAAVTTNFSLIHESGRTVSAVDRLLGLRAGPATVAVREAEEQPVFSGPVDPPNP
jgi:hypothetical protein